MQDCKFFIKSSNSEFTARQRNIFNSLSAFEKEKEDLNSSSKCATETMEVDNISERGSFKRKRSETKHFRGKESIFKKPINMPPRYKTRDIPDHQRNPHKWVKYTLGDVSPQDMTNQSNTAAALSFLQELKERKQKEVSEPDEVEVKRIIFKPSDKSLKKISPPLEISNVDRIETSQTCAFRSTKLVMPEYVVGMEKKLKRKKKATIDCQPIEAKKEIPLQHLFENEEDN